MLRKGLGQVAPSSSMKRIAMDSFREKEINSKEDACQDQTSGLWSQRSRVFLSLSTKGMVGPPRRKTPFLKSSIVSKGLCAQSVKAMAIVKKTAAPTNAWLRWQRESSSGRVCLTTADSSYKDYTELLKKLDLMTTWRGSRHLSTMNRNTIPSKLLSTFKKNASKSRNG